MHRSPVSIACLNKHTAWLECTLTRGIKVAYGHNARTRRCVQVDCAAVSAAAKHVAVATRSREETALQLKCQPRSPQSIAVGRGAAHTIVASAKGNGARERCVGARLAAVVCEDDAAHAEADGDDWGRVGGDGGAQ